MVYFTAEQQAKLEAQILEIMALTGQNEVLVADIRDTLMGKGWLKNPGPPAGRV